MSTHQCECCGEPCACTPVAGRCEICPRCWNEQRIVVEKYPVRAKRKAEVLRTPPVSPGRPWELDDDGA
jgi:hypothetical protein